MPSEALLDGPWGPLQAFAEEHGLDAVVLIRVRRNRRRARAGLPVDCEVPLVWEKLSAVNDG